MDTRELVEKLKAELTCSICLGYFTDPVTARCGHNFCLECLLPYMQEAYEIRTCPVCRGVIEEDDLVVNKNLQSLSITVKMLRTHVLQSTMGLSTCKQHWEKEKFFCEEDQRLFCEFCLSYPEHKDHQISPLQTAVHKCKEKLQEKLSILQKKEKECNIALNGVRRRRDLFEKYAQGCKQLVISEYKKMYQFLWEEEQQQLQKMDQEFRDHLAKLEQWESNLCQDIQSLQQMIVAIEQNLDIEPMEMLQDMRGTLEGTEKPLLGKPEVSCPDWISYRITGLREMLLNFHRDITLDPETADPHFILSEDLKSVRYSSEPQDLPDEGFDCSPSVLGAQTFTSGKHYWEVEVGQETEWEVGICFDSVTTKGKFSTSPEEFRTLIGFHDGNDFFIWNSQEGFRQMKPIYKLGIFIDYEKGHIAFYNAIDRALLYSPPDLVFEKPLRPYFSPRPSDQGSTLASLIICPRTHQ